MGKRHEKTLTIIGAGISGMSLAHCLKDRFNVSLLETSPKPGGLIKCDTTNGNLFHKVGGHVFNTKNKEVLNWFWSFFDAEKEFVKAKKRAKILLNGNIIGYPIENFLYELEPSTCFKIVEELLLQASLRNRVPKHENFEAFLTMTFGATLYSLYFKPYNCKIWNTDLSTIPIDWLEGKLPMPNLKNILVTNILREEEREMAHSTFFYPKKGGSQFLADRLAKSLSISYNTPLSSVLKMDKGFLLNGQIRSDLVVYTGDVRQLTTILKPWSFELENALDAVKSLKSRGISTLFCECDDSDLSWLYLPEPFTMAHRIIYTGNFSTHNNKGTDRKTCVVEFSGKVTEETMKNEIKKLPGNLSPLDYNYEPNSYVVQEHDTREKINKLKNLLEPEGIFLLGRFAEWEYYNMDKAIEAALFLAKKM